MAELTHRQKLTVLSGLMLGMFLASLDTTVVVTAIRTIGDDLHGLSEQVWVTTAFLVTATIFTPIFGKLSDIYGRKRLYLVSIAIFIVGSLLCSLATSMYMLAVFRAIQGVGAGGITPLIFAILADIISPRERARYQSYYLTVYAASAMAGPLVGGFFAEADTILGIDGWRWIFLINVPLGAASYVVAKVVLKLEHHRLDHRIDWRGAVLLVVAVLPILLVAEQGRLWGWDSPGAWACYLIGVAGVALFVVSQWRMGDEALVPVRMFRSSTVSLGSLHTVVTGMVLLGGVAVVPLYLQIAKGATPAESGLLLAPLMVVNLLSAYVVGRSIGRSGRYRIFPIVGAGCFVAALVWLARVGADTPLWQTALVLSVFGIGQGLSLFPVMIAMQNEVEPRDIGVVTAANTFFRSIGATLGTALFLSILFARTDEELAPIDDEIRAGLPAGAPEPTLDDSTWISLLPDALERRVLVGFADATNTVFAVAAGIAVLAFVLALLIKERPLRTTSGAEAARVAREAAAAESAAG
ncbi:MDR family MFS transporter [Nocardioides sp. cx-173]|uniref:MDR family MFS transporter n=1 Tax=Nocardioides sp. cx-173 TaxID=2898796 RepID=UPI001E59FFB1|nr:MDR family MFS transporter [Nocardioides sp. cx-173]MCD4524246.1 MFS transporter [Nocardioides sp. cx-173]UGB41638.1 MFS transporter [Nocardioides sp. cx-173]